MSVDEYVHMLTRAPLCGLFQLWRNTNTRYTGLLPCCTPISDQETGITVEVIFHGNALLWT